MKILAIDPGERVGWAHATVGDGQLEITGHGISRLKDFALKLFESIGNYDVVVYETYRISSNRQRLFAHIGSDVPTLQLIGMIRLAAWLHPKVRLVGQGPSVKTTAAKWIAKKLPQIQTKLEALPKSHDEAHDGDALLHLGYYVIDKEN